MIIFYIFIDYTGSMSVYEFINSYRESNDSPHPKLRSKTTIEALEKLKEMKDEIGEGIFLKIILIIIIRKK